MKKSNDCIAQAIYHALTLLKHIPDYSLIENDVPDIALPYALLPQIAAHYRLYVTEVPRSLPLHLLRPECVFIIIYRTHGSCFHAITSHNNNLFDPQANTSVNPSSLVGTVVAIYLCQPALSLGQVYAETLLAQQALEELPA